VYNDEVTYSSDYACLETSTCNKTTALRESAGAAIKGYKEVTCYPNWNYDDPFDVALDQGAKGLMAILGAYFALVLIILAVIITFCVMCIRCCMGLPPCCCCGNGKTTNVYHVVNQQPNVDPYAQNTNQ
jgi:hypothetical protein